MSPTFDYDATDISRAYAAARTLTEERARVWRAHLRDELETHDVREIIDLGCGVGRFSPLLREVFHARVYAIDPSERMLASAIANPEAHLVTLSTWRLEPSRRCNSSPTRNSVAEPSSSDAIACKRIVGSRLRR